MLSGTFIGLHFCPTRMWEMQMLQEHSSASIPYIPSVRWKLLLHFQHSLHPFGPLEIAPAFPAFPTSL